MSSFGIVDPEGVPTEEFQTCEPVLRKLTKLLDCTELRVNQMFVEPWAATTPRSTDGHEEVFVAVTGGQIAIEDDVHDVPKNGLVRVHEATTRNLLTRADEPHIWPAIGAPPVGSVDDFGAYIAEEG